MSKRLEIALIYPCFTTLKR